MDVKTPKDLINEYNNRIVQLQKEIDSHPFIYSPGFRFKDESNYNYRRVREDEINRTRERIKNEEARDQLLQHNYLNKQLSQNGLPILQEPKTTMEKLREINDITPWGQFYKAVTPVTEGLGNFLGGPSSIVLIIGAVIVAVIVLPMIFKK